ncbi:MAG: CCA tRNA nucleotidyltransferase [Pseudomonadota bacterium]
MTDHARPLSAEEKPAFAWMDAPRLSAIIAPLEAAYPGSVRFVGGCVRDSLLAAWAKTTIGTARESVPLSTDIDVATPLVPEKVMALLRAAAVKTIPTGIDHGTVTAVSGESVVEITTLRRDVTTDGRRATIAYTDDWREDAARRDFTINALYLTPTGQIHDYEGGFQDLRDGKVAFIGDAKTRIAEDYLRILRFIRFSARFATDFDAAGLAAVTTSVEGLMTLSAERIAAELMKILAHPRALLAAETMADAGILSAIWSTPARLDLARRLDTALQATNAHAFLVALYPDDFGALAQRLRLSNRAQDHMAASFAAANALAGSPSPADERRARQVIYQYGAGVWLDALCLYAAFGEHSDEQIASLRDMASRWTPPVFPVKGGTLIARGLSPGPAVSRALNQIESRWIAEDFPDGPRLEALVAEAIGEV